MPNSLREQALVALAAVRPTTDNPAVLRARTAAAIRDAMGDDAPPLRELAAAVNWAMEQPAVDFNRFLVGNTGTCRVYRFGNGHTASVLLDPNRAFRFEVATADGDTVGDLTSEQTEARLVTIAGLPTR